MKLLAVLALSLLTTSVFAYTHCGESSDYTGRYEVKELQRANKIVEITVENGIAGMIQGSVPTEAGQTGVPSFNRKAVYNYLNGRSFDQPSYLITFTYLNGKSTEKAMRMTSVNNSHCFAMTDLLGVTGNKEIMYEVIPSGDRDGGFQFINEDGKVFNFTKI